MFIINRLEEVAQIVKNEPDHDERPKVMREELSKIVFPKSFQLPLDPYKTCRGIQIDKCRVMDSKKLPLWLTFIREDPWEPPLVVLFKSGVLCQVPYTLAEDGTVTFKEGAETIEGVVHIDKEKVVSVIIPEGAKVLGEYALGGCKLLAAVTLPQTMEEIGDEAFKE